MASSSSSSRNWVYDVFVSFRGEDVRKTFLSQFLKELDRKLIKTFIDGKIEKGQSLDPVLKQAIRTSRIAVVLFSENYASSSWCLDELVEIVNCKEELDQVVLPIFYGLDPTHVRKQTGKFGEVFAKTCQKKSKKKTKLWRQSLTKVANLCGNYPQNWSNEAKMVEEIVDDVLGKILNLIPRKEFENFVGMEDHIAKMNALLDLKSEEVRMIGIWGSSGIGKTSIARTLYSQLSHRFQCKIFIDKAFVSNVMKKYENPNPYDPKVKSHLVGSFLSEILDKRDIKIDSFDAMRQMLKHHKVLIFIDDLDHQEVLDTLVGQTQWFGCGSRIIVITEDKRLLRAHGIDYIYEVYLPSDELALKIFCKSAFGKYFPPDGLMEFASKITSSAGNLPLGLHFLGSYVKGRNTEALIEMQPYILKGLHGDIEKMLRVSYDGLDNENHKAIFRHIACLFNGERASNVKLLLADSDIDVIIGLENLVDKALIHIRDGIIVMRSLLQKMGKEIVRAQSYEPGEREFLVGVKDICDLLENNSGTNKVLGIALDMEELHIHELRIHESAFEKRPNLLFLKFYTKDWYQNNSTTKWDNEKGVRWHLPEGFDYLPKKLRLLTWERYPMRCMPSSFCTKNLVKLEMRDSKLERLWEGVQTLNRLKEMDLRGSIYLKEIPDLSKATNLEKLSLRDCSCLVELPFSIKYLNKLEHLDMSECSSLETLPNGINLQSLNTLDLQYCPRLKSFPDISTNTSTLYLSQDGADEAHFNLSGGSIGITGETLWARAQPYSLRELYLWFIPSLVELPSSIKNFTQLEKLIIYQCINLETLPTDINFFSLRVLSFYGCSRIRIFPNISTNIEELDLSQTGIEEVPWWIENFTKLRTITTRECSKLVHVSLNIYKLKLLERAYFERCKALSEASWNDHPIAIDEILSGVEVPLHFIHQTTGYSLTHIPLHPTSLSQQLYKFRACVVVVFDYKSFDMDLDVRCEDIDVRCEFRGKSGNNFLWVSKNKVLISYGRDNVVFVLDSLIPLDECNAPLAQLNYDHVNMEIHIDDWLVKLKRWGVQLLDECSSPMNALSNPYKVLHVCEDNLVSDSEYNEECIQTIEKRQRETGSLDLWEKQFKKMLWGKQFKKTSETLGARVQNCIKNKKVDPVIEAPKQGEISTMVTYGKPLPEHKVFINFHGAQMRRGFVSHLKKALDRDGVNAYIDDEKMGEDPGNIFKRIEDSTIALVIFSTTYTESTLCLNELVKIKECMDKDKLFVIPIFYKVEPLEVTQLKGDFGVKFWDLWKISRDHHIIKWKEALESVASMKGTYSKKSSESEFITVTVKKVLKRISLRGGKNASFLTGKEEKHETYLSKYPFVGMKQRMEQLEKKLEFDCNETRIVGVVGMPGIGKTTLAMMLYGKWNCKFVRCLPLLDIHKKSKDNGTEWLRKTLLEVLLQRKFPVINGEMTHQHVKDELLQSKSLVVLDDVSEKKQLEFLLDNLDWIKKGSKIVITTSDKSLLKEYVRDTYVVPELNDREAFELFTNICSPTSSFQTLSRMFVHYTQGNPLALSVLGRGLRGKDKAHWKHIWATVTKRFNLIYHDVLRFFNDQLNEKQEEVFLDIECFFKSEDEYFVRSLLDSGDPDSIDTVSEVRDLANRFLITISEGRVEVNDLLYTFGKNLSSPRWLRLWNYKDIINELKTMERSKANNVRGIFLDMSKFTKTIYLDHSTFIDMKNLLYLKIYDSCCPRKCIADCNLYVSDGFELPLQEVRYLHWVKFPLHELPPDFRPENLVDLRLPYSKIERLWEGVKDTPRLKSVDLSYSSKLFNLSALSKAENVRSLNLEGCTVLNELPVEIQNMKSLVLLNLRGCIHLASLPPINLISLKVLILSGCAKLEEFQLISESVQFLHLDGTAIKGLPPAIQNLQRLVVLDLKNCKMLEYLPSCMGKLKYLDELILSGCSRLKNFSAMKHSLKHLQILLLDGTGVNEMPSISCFTEFEGSASADSFLQSFGSYSTVNEWPRGVDRVCSLRRLVLSGNIFVSLQPDIGKLYNLIWLDVTHCKMLTSIPMLPPRLQYFDAHGCESLESVSHPLSFPVVAEQMLATFNFSNCNKLDRDAKDSIISYTRWRSESVLDALSRYNGGSDLEDFTGSCFPGWEVPAWFSFQASGSMLETKLPPHWCDNRFTGIALCAVIVFPRYKHTNRLFVKCKCVFNYEDRSHTRFICTIGKWREPCNTPGKIEPPHVFIGYTSKLNMKKYGEEEDEERCSQSKASFEFQVTDGTEMLEGCKVIKCGFSLVYATDERENIRWDEETVVIREEIENIPGESRSYGSPESRNDIQYKSYYGHRLKRDRIFFSNTNSETLKIHSLVGVELRLKQMEKLLYSTPGKTCIFGVVGVPGIGKTTHTKILFEKRGCKFPSHLFLTMPKECKLEQLRMVLLKELLKHLNQDVNEETTHESVKEALLQSKVFLVLDDVSDKKQLEFLLGNLDWVKKGSKIVIITRDKSLLEGIAHGTYVVQQLNNREAFQLFTNHAFDNQMCPSETLLSLSRMFVNNVLGNPLDVKSLDSYLCGKEEAHNVPGNPLDVESLDSYLCGKEEAHNVPGNPLDVKSLGSYLCGKEEAHWQDALQRVRRNFNMKMKNVWRFSIDQLNERQRDVFLNIVQLEMHDQLCTSGKDLGSPGQHRLGNYTDVHNKANHVKGISLDMSEMKESIAMDCMTFIDMRNLLYLKIYDSRCPQICKADCNLYFPDGFEFPLQEIRYLHWVKFPLQELPPDLRPDNLVYLRLPYSSIERVWKGVKVTPRLKWVDLRHSTKLIDLSALSKAENLQRLVLEGCTSLDELPLEIQNMKSLVFLNLRGCTSLYYLPKMNLISLKTLILSDCSNLNEFQLISESVEFLHLDGTAIERLPPAIQNLQRLILLNLKNCKMLEYLPNCMGKLINLNELILSGCSRLKNLSAVSLTHIQILLLDGTGANEMPRISSFTGFEGSDSADIFLQSFGSSVREYASGVNGVSSLRRLCLSGNDFITLEPEIRNLYNLNWLDVKHCKKLIFVPTLPPRLQYFDAHGCDSLERVENPLALPVVSKQNHAIFNFSDCNTLDQDARDSIISYTRWRSHLVLDELIHYYEGSILETFTGTCFPGWEVPAWFSHRAFKPVLKPKLPLCWSENRFTGIALCAVISFHSNHEQRTRFLVKCNCVFNNEDGSVIRFSCNVGSWSETSNTPRKIQPSHVFIGYTSMLDIKKLGEDDEEGCSPTEASLEFQVTDGTEVLEGYEVVKCGFSFIYTTDQLRVKSGVRGASFEANRDRTYSNIVASSVVGRETEAAERSPDCGDKATSLQQPVSPAEYRTRSNNSGRERHKRSLDVDPRLSAESQHHSNDLIPIVASSSQAEIRRSRSQVFVSYHGELSRTFVRHLVNTLTDEGFNVFTDKDKRNGTKQLRHLYQRIKESKIALIIFSNRYVESYISLNELVMMNELAKEGKLLVIPVFYNVRSSDVRNLKGEFGQRFKEMRDRYKDECEEVPEWETSLKSIAKTIGIHPEIYGKDASLVEATVEAVQRALTKISDEGSVNTGTDYLFVFSLIIFFCYYIFALGYISVKSSVRVKLFVHFLVWASLLVLFFQNIGMLKTRINFRKLR